MPLGCGHGSTHAQCRSPRRTGPHPACATPRSRWPTRSRRRVTVGDLVARAGVSARSSTNTSVTATTRSPTAFTAAFAAATADIAGDPGRRIVALFDFAAEHRAMYRNVVPSAVTQRVVAAFRAELAARMRGDRRPGHADCRRRRRPDPEAVSRFLVGGFMEVLRSWMEDPDATDLRGRVTAALDTVDALLGLRRSRTTDIRLTTKGFTVGKHTLPSGRRRPPAASATWRSRWSALTVFVIAMIASYSGAFAKPTLHHLTVAVAGPQQIVDAIRGQDALAVTQVGDDAAARAAGLRTQGRRRLRRRPRRGDMKIYVAGGGGRSVANAAETVGRAIAAKARPRRRPSRTSRRRRPRDPRAPSSSTPSSSCPSARRWAPPRSAT